MSGKGKNLAASVRQRLLNIAKRDDRPFSEVAQYYAIERFLYRLSCSAYAKKFVLKGALMLSAWRSPVGRPTMDIDLLGITDNDISSIKQQMQDICQTDVEPDGVEFDINTIIAERITEDADYAGVRVKFTCMLTTARVPMQIDIGFDDEVFPSVEEAELPVMLDAPAPRLACYSKESVIAEKFQTMVKLGELNSRMKDFYDIWLLSRQYDFDGTQLAEAVRRTFEKRNTKLEENISAFTAEFATTKQTEWRAFAKRLEQESLPEDFADVVAAVKEFLSPLAAAIASGKQMTVNWKAGAGWQ